MIGPRDVLEFWFAGDPRTWRDEWFEQSDAFDAACAQFADALRAARSGALDHWAETPHGMLALILLLDQFSRNLHRGSAESFAADAQACELLRRALAAGLDRELGWIERAFMYLPFEHSEELADQDEGVRLFGTLRIALGDSTVEYAHRHRDLIRKFGRFPHRNAVMGRECTDEERAFLETRGRGF